MTLFSLLSANRQQVTLRKDRHRLSSPRFNPSFHTPGFSNLPAFQFRLDTSRKARLAAALENSPIEPSAPNEQGVIGKTKLRGTKNEYHWRKTTGVGTIQEPGPVFEGAVAGDLRIHQYQQGSQVWVLAHVKAGTTRQYQWTVPVHGLAHPTLDDYFLQLNEKKPPSWVKRNTINSYASRMKRATESSPAPTEDSAGPGARYPTRVRRFRIGAPASP